MSKQMMAFENWSDLEAFGVGYLTSEACANARRILFDLSEEGREHVRTFLGLKNPEAFEENRNSRVGQEKAVASVLLPASCFTDLVIHVAARAGYAWTVTDTDRGVVHAVDAESERDVLRAAIERPHTLALRNPTGNEHVFSGIRVG